MRFASAVSRELDACLAARDLSMAVRRTLQNEPVDLACLFFSSHYRRQVDELSRAISNQLSPRVMIGCSGEGIIGPSEEVEQSPAVTLWAAHLPGTTLTPLRLTFEENRFSLHDWAAELRQHHMLPTVVMFADPFSAPMDEVLALLGDECPGAVAIGGMAGGGHDEGETRLLLDEDPYDDGLVAVAISGPVSIRTIVSQGCRPIGERYVVTKAERNLIHELAGMPALECLQGMFESLSGHDRNLVQQALHVGIVMDEQRNRFERGDFLVRNLIGADRSSGSVAIGDLIKEGQTIQFHVRDAQAASEDLHLLLAADRARHRQPALGALLFSCCGRGRGLFGRPHHDVSVVRERAGDIPLAGFFAQGEIGPVAGTNFLHGYTASVALFAEPDE